jgi:hypothetical protein
MKEIIIKALLKYGFYLILVAGLIVTGYLLFKKSRQADRFTTNIQYLKDTVVKWKTPQGHTVSQTGVYMTTIKELRSALKEKDGKLAEMAYNSQMMGAKLRNLEEAIQLQINSSNALESGGIHEMGGGTEQELLASPYMQCVRTQEDNHNSVMSCTYKDTLDAVITRVKTGFFLFRPFKPWEVKLSTKLHNPRASITHQEIFRVKR